MTWLQRLRTSAAPMRHGRIQCLTASQLHYVAYTEWGAADNPRVLLCLHGLTRTGRDFDFLAAALAKNFRVVCPDMPGRGQSDWLEYTPGYALPMYAQHVMALLARLNVETIDCLGTSMGGLIGLLLAAQAHTPIQRLILNDVGPHISAQALSRISSALGKAPVFNSMAEAEHYLRTFCSGFGLLSPAQWQHLTKHSVIPEGKGWRMRYDPAIGDALRAAPPTEQTEALLWSLYDAIRVPSLLLRGEDSDLLSRETAQAMTQRGPRPRCVEFAQCGHAPMLMSAEQIAVVRDFLK